MRSALKGKKLTSKDVSDWLSSSHTYTLHKPIRKTFKRRKYIVSGINSLWQDDLTDVQKLSKANSGYKFILFNVDVFSRKAAAIPLKSKSTAKVAEGFATLLNQYSSAPDSLQTDKGVEFTGKQFQSLLKKHKIHHYFYNNQEIKASLVERLQRTIRSKIYRYFTHTGSYRYVEALTDFISAYNDTVHSAIGLKPNQVDSSNQEELWQAAYNENDNGERAFKFSIGDKVRISKYSTTFRKGYLPSWSEEIFTVCQRHFTSPPVYSLRDESGDELQGTWYEPELQKVSVASNIFRIEKIIGQRKVNGKTQYLVRWAGYPPSFDSYINKTDLIPSYKN